MAKVTRRQALRAGVAAGATLGGGAATAGSEKEKPSSFVDHFLPAEMTAEGIRAAKGVTFTKHEYAGAAFWVGVVDWLGDSVPHALLAVYAPHKDGGFRRSLFAESWAVHKIEAGVDKETGVLELRGQADVMGKRPLVLACSLRTVGTQHSIPEK